MADTNTIELTAQDQKAVAPLTQEELEARRKWYRDYRKANPQKVQQWEKNRWHKKAQQQQAGTGKRHKKQGAGT